MLPGERQRDFVLTHEEESRYLAAAPGPLRSLALLLIDTGLRLSEALHLRVGDIHIEPVGNARYGWLRVRDGKSRNAKRTVPLTGRMAGMLRTRLQSSDTEWLFPCETAAKPMLGTSMSHAYTMVCRPFVTVGKKRIRQYPFPKEFVLHSLRHTCLTRLGEAGAEAFTII